jgi:hypothetical protein
MTMTALITTDKMKALTLLDTTSREGRQELAEARRSGNEFAAAIATASLMQRVRSLLTPDLLQDLMALQQNQLGFNTDKPYPVDVVRDCAIVAMIRGARVVGNEFNIISGKAYLTKEYFERQVREFPGISHFRDQYSIPEHGEGGKTARIACRASWTLDGKQDSLACLKGPDGDFRISVRVNSGMGEDAMLGKAKRKFLAKVLAVLQGVPDETEAEDAGIESVAEPAAAALPAPAAEAASEIPAVTETGTTVAFDPLKAFEEYLSSQNDIGQVTRAFTVFKQKYPDLEEAAVPLAMAREEQIRNAAPKGRRQKQLGE